MKRTSEGRPARAGSSVLTFVAMAGILLSLAGCRNREAAASLPRIEVTTARNGRMPEVITFAGYLNARRRSNVSATASGTVARVLVREGSHVSQGEPLLILDSAEAQAKVSEQQASVAAARARVSELEGQLTLARVQQSGGVRQAELTLRQTQVQMHEAQLQLKSLLGDLKRKRRLYSGKAVPYTQVEAAELAWRLGVDRVNEAEGKVTSARDALQVAKASAPRVDVQSAQLDGARSALTLAIDQLRLLQLAASDLVLRAPVSGSIITVGVTPGQAVSAGGNAVFVIVDNSTLELVAAIDHSTMALLHKGAQVTFSTLADRSESYNARLSDIVPTWDETTRTVKSHFTVLSSDARLMDGLAVRARLQSRDYVGVLVPVTAVARGESGEFVLVIEGGVAKRRPVSLAIQDQTYALIEKGLSQGETVALQNVQDIADGQRVEVLTGEQAARLESASSP